MPWVRFDDGVFDHPKVGRVGPVAQMLFFAGIVYSARNLTDGFIPFGRARNLIATDWTVGRKQPGRPGDQVWTLSMVSGMQGLSGQDVIEQAIDQLLDAELWANVGRGYAIHDYLDYQPSRQTVAAERSATAARQKRYRERQGHNAASNGVTNGPVTPAPYPYPYQESHPTGVTPSRARKRARPAGYEDPVDRQVRQILDDEGEQP